MGVYIFISAMKFLEVAIFSLRTSLITSGEKKISSIIGFFEVIVWTFGTGTVVKYVFEDLFILIPYLIAGAIGVYVGMGIENIISKRDTVVISFVKSNFLDKVMSDLKKENYGLTVLDSEEENKMLLIATKKNRIHKIKKIIKKIDLNSTIITNAASDTVGGYIY